LSRLQLFLWLGALGAAAYPTWEVWSALLSESLLYTCGGSGYWSESVWQQSFDPLLLPLRADVQALVAPAITWAVPALVVLWTLRHRHSARAGRQAAATLTLLAVLDTFAVPYFDPEACDVLHPFTTAWFARAGDQLGTTDLPLLVAAALLLLATQFPSPAERPLATPGRIRSVARWTATCLIAYWAVALVLSASDWDPSSSFVQGLLCWLYQGDWMGVLRLLAVATVITLITLLPRTRQDWRTLLQHARALL
jgi:hypothetical protein